MGCKLWHWGIGYRWSVRYRDLWDEGEREEEIFQSVGCKECLGKRFVVSAWVGVNDGDGRDRNEWFVGEVAQLKQPKLPLLYVVPSIQHVAVGIGKQE